MFHEEYAMDELSFLVQVSSDTPHCTVTVRNDGDIVTARCTCESGGPGVLCKHRLSILSGQTKWVISNNLLSVKRVLTWVASTDIGHTIVRQAHAQRRVHEAREELENMAQRLKTAEAELVATEAEAVDAKQALIQAVNG